MTRINLVPPEELMDQHLFAEYREIKMVPKSLARSIEARGIEEVLDMVPLSFRLNTGHVSFFYDKGAYLYARYEALKDELTRRGVNFDKTRALDPDGVLVQDPRFMGSYTPTPQALEIVRERIRERVADKPDWYKYKGVAIYARTK